VADRPEGAAAGIDARDRVEGTASGVDARRAALWTLCRVEGDRAWSNLALSGALQRVQMTRRDRAFTADLVRGTLRWQLSLDSLLKQVLARPLSTMDVAVRQALRLGAYQLVEAGTPPHAAVSSTVEALGHEPGRRLVNAALRALSRLGPPWPYPEDKVLASFPRWLRREWAGGEEMLRALQRPASTHVRLRRGREAEAKERLPRGAVPGRLVPRVYRLEGGGDPSELIGQGLATVQDEASAAVGLVVRPLTEGGLVVDLCAGPGGKATHVAEELPSSRVLALDIHAARARRVALAACRLALPNVVAVAADSRAAPIGPLEPGAALLLDAPCSGLGSLRRRPEIRFRVRRDDLAPLSALQRDLARAAAKLVPPGGILVYSACTLTQEETYGVALALLERTGLVEEEVDLPLLAHPVYGEGPGGFLLPHEHDTDGMYVLVVRRKR
jgi:16S rRNA (cytosine967-C5)-methyltransferase